MFRHEKFERSKSKGSWQWLSKNQAYIEVVEVIFSLSAIEQLLSFLLQRCSISDLWLYGGLARYENFTALVQCFLKYRFRGRAFQGV